MLQSKSETEHKTKEFLKDSIINSIAMSVSSRSKQYGSFRAIGLSTGQLRKMIVAEAFTYTIIGGIVGTILGLLMLDVKACGPE